MTLLLAIQTLPSSTCRRVATRLELRLVATCARCGTPIPPDRVMCAECAAS